ncbi:hypothetical protein SETIT_3G213000v2 [Setaria italica]|uniref:Uncharacterized protein n=1 Tax=Setaria italica TaxID=4555 RepID=A0A368QH90_SETIT|nr:hypothetical protein SETIT_3G213000v2 [Setaria italica]
MQTIHNPVAAEPVLHGAESADSKDEDGSTSVKCDPWNPELPPPAAAIYEADDLNVQLKMIFEYEAQNDKILSESRSRSIITPKRTPKSVRLDFCVISPCLSTILKKDSVRSFLNLFAGNWRRLVWGRVITPHTFNFIVRHDALHCAKVAVEGKAPKLGSFPLHQAAMMFSLDMINLLIDYGASANVHIEGNKVIEGLLPLHVAVEDACMHKYLEAVGKQAPQRQDYRMFIPYWRSMLQSRLPVRMILAHALKSQHKPGTRRFHTAAGSSGNMSKDGRSLFLNCSLRLMGRAPQLRIHQSRRMYTTAALFF